MALPIAAFAAQHIARTAGVPVGSSLGLGALGGPVGIGVSLAAMAAPKIRNVLQAKDNATRFVSGFENPFTQQLAQISNLANTDPDAAAEQLRSSWNTFYSQTQKMIAKGGNDAKVARQALGNTDLIRTVDTIAAQLGIPNLRSGGASVAPFSGNPQGVPLSDMGKGGFGGIWNRLPDITSGRGTARTGSTFPGGSTVPTGTTKQIPSSKPKKPAGEWDWLLDAIIPASVTGGLNLLGGYLGSRASKDAAEILAKAGIDSSKLLSDAADKVLAQQKGIYDQSRQDLMPWLNTGRAALGELSNRMGLQPEGVPLNTMAGAGAKVPDFDSAAERYRQGRMRG